MLKTGEEEQKLESAELLKLEDKLEEAHYSWKEAKDIFRKCKIDRESLKQVHETNFIKQNLCINEGTYRGIEKKYFLPNIY